VKKLLIITSLLFFSINALAGITHPAWKKISLPLERWQGPPFRMVMVSDLHLGLYLRHGFLNGLVKRINEHQPDLVVIVGDLLSWNPARSAEMLSPLKDLKAPLGVFFSPGNHEFCHRLPPLLKILQENNVTVLINKTVALNKQFNLMGVSDPLAKLAGGETPNFDKADLDRNSELPTILLAHQPRLVRRADDQVDLTLSGHTHNGQIFPMHLVVWLEQKGLIYGLYRWPGNRYQYVSSGAGVSGLPLRLFSRSEIVEFQLSAPVVK
jgi:uncharacterized protein